MLGVGDRVTFDGGEHEIVGIAGTSVQLRGDDGAEQVVLAGYLMAAADFALHSGQAWAVLEPFGLLDSLPPEVVAGAERWRGQVVEVETGFPHGTEILQRPGFDPGDQHAGAATAGQGRGAGLRGSRCSAS